MQLFMVKGIFSLLILYVKKHVINTCSPVNFFFDFVYFHMFGYSSSKTLLSEGDNMVQ